MLVAVTGIVILVGRATPSLGAGTSIGTLAAMWPSPPPDPTNVGEHPSVPPPPPVSSPVPRLDVNQMSRAEVEAYIAEEKAKQPKVKPPENDLPLSGWRQPIPWAYGKILHYVEMHDNWVAPDPSHGVIMASRAASRIAALRFSLSCKANSACLRFVMSRNVTTAP